MFAALTFDRDPLTFADVPGLALLWLQVVGGFAGFCVLLWLLLGYGQKRQRERDSISPRTKALFLVGLICGVAGYAVSIPSEFAITPDRRGRIFFWMYVIGVLVGGGSFLLLAGAPFVYGQTRTRLRRVFALAKLSFKEALRRRILYAFAGFLLVLMFASWFLFETKPDDEVRTYVELVFTLMALMLLPAAALISAFSLPADIKNQTIHTVVTKPVERFEIILGRFLGFLSLMTLVLLALTAVSVLYVLRGVRPEAAKESLNARVVQYGVLGFENTENAKDNKGVSVGREWDYRSYITKSKRAQDPETAIWTFAHVPAYLASRDSARFEYTFDVYRTTKGDKEGADVTCTVRFFTWRYARGNDVRFRADRGQKRDPELDNELARKYGYYEITGLPVTDYHTQPFEAPKGLFENISAAATAEDPKERGPDLTVRVICESDVQYVGMARYDLYLRTDRATGIDTPGFVVNFFKAAFGLWLLLALVIGLCVVLSSQLSGVITLLAVGALLGCGAVKEFVVKVAYNTNDGAGGPAESMLRIVRREISAASSLSESTSTTERLVSFSDEAFRWGLRRIFTIFPDVNSFFLTDYVAEGFDIPLSQMGIGLLQLAAYLLPWFVLSYYLIRWREIAGPT